MNIKYIKSLVAAAAIFAATGPALAGIEWVATGEGFVSTKTRAEVVAERDQAIADGTLTTMSLEGVAPIQFASSRNREEVRSEARQANQDQFAGNIYLY